MQDFNLCSEFGSFLIELSEASDLPSQPPVVKVADVALEVHEVTAWPNKEGVEPGGEWFDGVLLTVPNHVGLCIQIDNIGGLIWALLLVEARDSTVLELLDPFRRFEDSVTQGNEELGDSPIVFDVSIGGAFKYVFIVFDPVMKSGDLFFEVANFNVFMGVMSGNGCEEPLYDGSENVGIEVRVCRQRGRNGIGQHRWFWCFNRTHRERDAVLGGRGV